MKLLEKQWEKHYAKFVVISYWLLGLCNNFAYVIMLSAAHDLLEPPKNSTSNSTTHAPPTNHTNKYDCNDLSTGTILLADILPGICIKLIAPLFMHRIKYTHRVIVVVIANIMSYSMVALAPGEHKWLVFLGVMMASFGSSFGEITYLSMSTLYPRILSISGWSSGTGAAGLIGSFGYAFLTSIGLSPKVTILSMLFIPVLMVISYLALPSPEFSRFYIDIEVDQNQGDEHDNENDQTPINKIGSIEILAESVQPIGFIGKIKELASVLRLLSKYMIPLFFVYYAEYFINQGLFELAYFKDAFIKEHKNQYRWYNVAYQFAVFISRSSIKWIKISFLPIFPIFQMLNVGIFLSHLFLDYIPSIWIIFAVILWEGLLGGGCYVNAFFIVSIEVPKEKREFSIAVTSIADSFGIALAGFTAIPVHNAICNYGNS